MDYEYLSIKDSTRQKLNIIMEEIKKLNTAKMNYSIQELQSMVVYKKDQEAENQSQRILEELNDFLNKSTNIRELKESNEQNKQTRERYKEFIDEKDLDEKLDINLSTLENKIYTLADLSFKANKYTKWICKEAITLIADKNYSFQRIIKELKRIYIKENTKTNERKNSKQGIEDLVERIKNNEFEGWEENINGKIKEIEIESYITNLYKDISEIWDLQEVLYEIKSQLNKQLVKCLIKNEKEKKDINETNFLNWGFLYDQNINMWVLNFAPKMALDRYSFHVPNLGEILSEKMLKKVKLNKDFKYSLFFTNIVRKNNLDRRKDKDRNKFDNKELIEKNNEDIIKMFSREQIDYEQYTMASFFEEEDFSSFIQQHPELKERCEELKALIYNKKPFNIDSKTLKSIEASTEFEQKVCEQIENNIMEHKRIFIQCGENLDKYASIYAIKKHMRKKGLKDKDIEVIEINAGEDRAGIMKKGLFLDAGYLKGSTSLTSNSKWSKEINANETRAEKSTCGVLSQYGIYVPKKIVQYADEVINNERILNARDGLYLSRKLRDKKLFEFAKAKREDGTYFIETSLTDEELERWGLTESYQKREEEIKKDIDEVSKNIYSIDDNGQKKYIAVVDKYINCGSWIAYSLGCDYYLSIADKKAEFIESTQDLFGEQNSTKATFSMLANPKKGNGQLPNSVIEWCEELRDKEENSAFEMKTKKDKKKMSQLQKPFISPKKDKVIFGGLKTPNLFIELKDKEGNVTQALFETMKTLIGFEKMQVQEKKEVIKNETRNWKSKEAKEIINVILDEIKEQQLTRTEVYQAGEEILNLTKERGENIVIN